MSAFIGPLPPDNHPDEQPTSAAKLSIVLELIPGATIGELMRDLATAMRIAVTGHTSAKRDNNRWKIS